MRGQKHARRRADGPADSRYAVESVSWRECASALGRLGLSLPTEAQWEYAARAGTDWPWWTGPRNTDLEGAANLGDRRLREGFGPPSWFYADWLDDGYEVHAPVGTYRQNAFGLHDVHGNVWEWCRDLRCGYDSPAAEGDGERRCDERRFRVFRGGSFFYAAGVARSAYRYFYPPEFARHNLGVRPSRAIEFGD